MFEDKPTTSSNHGVAGNDRKPNKDSYLPPDQAKIKKLKSKAKSYNFSKEAWEKHTSECMNVTFHTTGRRVCFWCIESACLDKRMEGYRAIPDLTKQTGVKEDYRIYRHKLDTATKEQCPAYNGVDDKAKNGVQVYASTINKVKK